MMVFLRLVQIKTVTLEYPGFRFRRHLDFLSPFPTTDYFPDVSRFREQLSRKLNVSLRLPSLAIGRFL